MRKFRDLQVGYALYYVYRVSMKIGLLCLHEFYMLLLRHYLYNLSYIL